MSLNLVNIDATTLADAWYQAVYKLLEVGGMFTIDGGSNEQEKRLEFDYITIHIRKPGERPLLPSIPTHYGIPNPVADNYLDDYLPYLMTGVIKKDESYTYGQRITMHPISKEMIILHNTDINNILVEKDIWENKNIIKKDFKSYYLNQMELAIWNYKNKGHRTNQMVLQIAQPTDMLLEDPPCLRSIDTRIQDGKLHFIIYFRSWDLWGGFPANLAGIQMMKEYMAAEIGVEDGEMIVSSKGLHIYNYVWNLAECLRGKTIEELKELNNEKEN